MNKVIEHAITDMTVIVQAGMTLEGLQRQLAWQNQWLPVDPPSYRGKAPGMRTIGGLIATNSLGPLRAGVGDWRLLIMGMTWVDGMGTVIKGGGRTVKNVAGYNTPRLMIGSSGTLGAIAEVTLRTFARPADEQCVILFCDTWERAEEVVAETLLSPTTPAYIEAIGGRTFATNPLDLPTMKRGVAVAIGFLDRPQSCAAQIAMVRGFAAAQGLESISQTAAQAGRLRLWLTSEPVIESGVAGAGVRIHALSSQTCALVAAIEAAATKAGGKVWAVAEAATGVVRAVVFGWDAEGLVRRVVSEVAAGAKIVVTQGIGAGDAREADMTLRIKKAIDPENVFGTLAAT
jgi:FAD/FMN-containing dehydrogenase